MRLRTFLIYFFYVLIVCVPFSVEIGETTKLEFPLEVGIVFYNIFLLYYAFIHRQTIIWRNQVFLSVVVMCLASGLSIFNAFLPIVALKAWLIWSNYALTFYGTFLLISFTEKEKNSVLSIGTIAYGILLTYAAIQMGFLGLHYQHSYLMAKPFASGHTLLIAMGFPRWLYLSNSIFSKSIKSWQIGLWVFYTIFIMCSYSRLYWVLVPLFIVLFIYKYWKKGRWLLLAFGFCSIVVGYFSYQYIKEKRDREQTWLNPDDHNSLFVQLQSIVDLKKNESNTERAYRWKMGKIMFDEHPITGVGFNNYSVVYPEIIKRFDFEKTTRSDMKMNAHQWYLGTLYEQGFIGILALALFFIAILSQYKKLSFLSILIIMHYFALGIVEDFMLLPEIVPTFWMCIGLNKCLTSV